LNTKVWVIAKGFYYYAYLKDHPSAVRYFQEAHPLLPNSSRIPESLAYGARRAGQWEQSESFFNQAAGGTPLTQIRVTPRPALAIT